MNPSIVKRCLVGVVLAIAATLPGFQQLHTSVEGLKLIDWIIIIVGSSLVLWVREIWHLLTK